MAKIPDRIGKYEVIRRLGYGGMGTVYLARDPDLDRLLAIKVLRDVLFEDEPIQRFLREARAAGNLRHENIITVYDAGQHDHQPFMAMEYVDGISLGEMIRSRQPLALADKLSYLEQICSGLHYAHRQGIVHRDIKPANLMVDGRNVVRILDFGIARVEGSGMTRDGALIGTLNYMSPEQMLGRPVDHRSDIFAFGAVAYELLGYEKAFPGTLEDGLLHRLPHEPPRPLSELCAGLPDDLEALVLRTLAKLPQDRFGDLEEVGIALRQVRREVDPQLALEPLTPRRADGSGGGATPPPGSGAERREFIERRARQLAYHRDAARAALIAQDLDGAAAACEDALTLDPDDAEALQLLADIQRASEQRGLLSRERRERDRTVRKHLADADVKLSKGDLTSAAALLREALTIDPGNAAAVALLSRIEHPESSGQIAPPTIVRPSRRAAPIQSAGGDTLPRERPAALLPESRTSSASPFRRTAVAGGVVAVAVVSGVLWFVSRGDDVPPAAAVTASARPEPAVSAPLPAELPPVSAAETPPPAIVDADRALQEQIGRIAEAHRRGDVEGALAAIRPVLARTRDDRARGLARTIAMDARSAMTAAAAGARKQQAPDHSPGVFATAERARALSERAFERNDYVEAGTQALLATANYSHATREAAAAIAKIASQPPRAPASREADTPAPSLPAATPVVSVTNPGPVNPPAPSPSAPAAVPAPSPAAAPSNAAATSAPAAASALEAERAGMLLAMNRYQDAYRERSVKLLKAVYPSLPREMEQRLDRAFNRDCGAYDFAYLNPRFALTADDPTSATVTALTTYTCQPKSGKSAAGVSGQEVFLLRKSGDTWLIDRAIMDARAR